jgi:hypothetical protein
MLKMYKYCFYRFAGFWKHRGFADSECYVKSIGYVSTLQFANVTTLLMALAALMHIDFPSWLWIVLPLVILTVNYTIYDSEQLYNKCETRWKGESKKAKTLNKWMVVVFSILSWVLLVVSIKLAV